MTVNWGGKKHGILFWKSHTRHQDFSSAWWSFLALTSGHHGSSDGELHWCPSRWGYSHPSFLDQFLEGPFQGSFSFDVEFLVKLICYKSQNLGASDRKDSWITSFFFRFFFSFVKYTSHSFRPDLFFDRSQLMPAFAETTEAHWRMHSYVLRRSLGLKRVQIETIRCVFLVQKKAKALQFKHIWSDKICCSRRWGRFNKPQNLKACIVAGVVMFDLGTKS